MFDNYFDVKYLDFKNKFSMDEAIEKTVEVLLFQSSEPKCEGFKHKFSAFWHADLINDMGVKHLQTENMRWALGQYIQSGLESDETLARIIHLDAECVLFAIRFSGIIEYPNHPSWQVIRTFSKNINHNGLNNFLALVNEVQVQYNERLLILRNIEQVAKLTQVTAMIFSSLYVCEQLLPLQDEYDDLPYHFDTNDIYNLQDIWRALDDIIITSEPNKTAMNDIKIMLAVKKKLVPFLIPGQMNQELLIQYENFKQLVALRLELNYYLNLVVGAYSYQQETDYCLKQGVLVLNKSQKSAEENWGQKFNLLNAYWQWRGILSFIHSNMIETMKPHKMIASTIGGIVEALGITIKVKECLGIEYYKFENLELHIFDIVKTMTISKAFYYDSFIEPYLSLIATESRQSALYKMMMEGMLIGENRFPLTFAAIRDKAVKMSGWISHESEIDRVTAMRDILRFWSGDLQGKSNKGGILEQPFYRIDGYIFELPWIAAFQNSSTSLINRIRKLETKRPELQQETSLMEKQLGAWFQKIGFEVYPQYMAQDSSVGEIDLVAIYENHVIVIELKSSYIKQTVKEIYQYRNRILKKAAYQLDKKVDFVLNTMLPSMSLNIDTIQCHSWIVDTSLEFDHQYFGRHLKLSLDELIILLNGDEEAMNKMDGSLQSFKQHGSFELENLIFDSIQVQPLDLIQKVEDGILWKQVLSNV